MGSQAIAHRLNVYFYFSIWDGAKRLFIFYVSMHWSIVWRQYHGLNVMHNKTCEVYMSLLIILRQNTNRIRIFRSKCFSISKTRGSIVNVLYRLSIVVLKSRVDEFFVICTHDPITMATILRIDNTLQHRERGREDYMRSKYTCMTTQFLNHFIQLYFFYNTMHQIRNPR